VIREFDIGTSGFARTCEQRFICVDESGRATGPIFITAPNTVPIHIVMQPTRVEARVEQRVLQTIGEQNHDPLHVFYRSSSGSFDRGHDRLSVALALNSVDFSIAAMAVYWGGRN
jgi:hypothetical protein